MFKSPTRIIGFDVLLRHFAITCYNERKNCILNAKRLPPRAFGTYTLNKTKWLCSVTTKRPSSFNSFSSKGRASQLQVRFFFANVTTPLNPRWAGVLSDQNDYQPSTPAWLGFVCFVCCLLDVSLCAEFVLLLLLVVYGPSLAPIYTGCVFSRVRMPLHSCMQIMSACVREKN